MRWHPGAYFPLSRLPSPPFCLTMAITSCCNTLLLFDWHRKLHLQSPAHSTGTGTPCTVCNARFATAASLHRHYLDGYHLPAVRRLRSTSFLRPLSETLEEQSYCLPCCRAFRAGYGHSARTRLRVHNALHHLPRSSTPLRSQSTSGLATWSTPPPTPTPKATPPPAARPFIIRKPTPTMMSAPLSIPVLRPAATYPPSTAQVVCHSTTPVADPTPPSTPRLLPAPALVHSYC